ncbi:40067_t:CDS:2, partial [Gigaspora margarita]
MPLFDVFPKDQITVIAVDATYNTNRLKYELYMILGIIDRAGFPLTYLLVKPDQEEKHSKILLNCAREAHTICSEIDPTEQPTSKNQNIFNELFSNNELTKNMD